MNPPDTHILHASIRDHWGGAPLASNDESRERGQRPPPPAVIVGYDAIQNYIQRTQRNRVASVLPRLRLPAPGSPR